MDAVAAYLKDWLITYLKNRNIEKIEEKGETVLVQYKDRDVTFYVRPFIKDFAEFAHQKKGTAIVVFNAKENLDAVFSSWKGIKENKLITIYFVNPLSTLETKWILAPYTHDRVSDVATLKQGLKSMFEMVEPLTKEQAEKQMKAKSDKA